MKTVQLKEVFKGFTKISSIASILGLNSTGETSVITLDDMKKEIGVIKILKSLLPDEVYEIAGSTRSGGLVFAQNISQEHAISLFLSIYDGNFDVIVPSNRIGIREDSSASVVFYRNESGGPLLIKNKASREISVRVCFIPIV